MLFAISLSSTTSSNENWTRCEFEQKEKQTKEKWHIAIHARIFIMIHIPCDSARHLAFSLWSSSIVFTSSIKCSSIFLNFCSHQRWTKAEMIFEFCTCLSTSFSEMFYEYYGNQYTKFLYRDVWWVKCCQMNSNSPVCMAISLCHAKMKRKKNHADIIISRW